MNLPQKTIFIRKCRVMATFIQYGLAVVVIILATTYLWLQRRRSYWAKQAIPHLPPPSNPFTLKTESDKAHSTIEQCALYKQCTAAGHRYLGIYKAFIPVLMIFDLDLIKQVFIGDFEAFRNRGMYHNVQHDPLTRNLLRLDDDEWKNLRMKLTPTFSSGKMKLMFPTVQSIADRLVEVLSQKVDAGQTKECSIREYIACFTMDVIGSIAFGLDCDSLHNPKTEFRVIGDSAFASYRPQLEVLSNAMLKIFNLLRVRMFPKKLFDFYSKIVAENIKYREQNNIKRNDFFDILLTLKNNKTDDGTASLSETDMVAQAFLFFIAGYETSSTTMSFALYELSENQEIQDKARADVLQALKKHNNEFTYDCVKDMHYLKQVFSETLRKYPVGPLLKRVSTKAYRIPGTSHTIEKGVQILIPCYSIHYDPNIYPEPTKFDPDRFSPEEMQKRHPMSFLGFGAGPRICIAERFGKMQSLIGLANLLKNFKFISNGKIPKHPQFDPKIKRTLTFIGGMTLTVERI